MDHERTENPHISPQHAPRISEVFKPHDAEFSMANLLVILPQTFYTVRS
jgi:hypothetical protein